MNETFSCIDAHTCGNPVRVVVDNAPALQGANMIDKRHHFLQEYDWIRTGLMFEPRGHDAMSGSILYPPTTPDGDLAVLFIEVSGCLPMCGHGTMGTVTVAIEQGLVNPAQPGLLKLDTPAGRVDARYEMQGDKVSSVSLTNVPAFCYIRDLQLDVPEWGNLTIDISYGGNFYAIVEPQAGYSDLQDLSVDQIRQFSPLVRAAANQALNVVHPENSAINGVSHVMWTGKPKDQSAHARNAVFYGDRGIDRSPCGTGTCARMAQLNNKQLLEKDREFVHESIIGSLFTGKILDDAQVGDYAAVIPEVSGWAKITGHNQINISDDDPYAKGFLLT